ncbi:ribonuclease III [Silvibacterium dinghuense]|uniref:Ribonuclease 3 n=1 Tax=Silvibacterium dinghuense TaxID=1560006 RepID=A0A4Q1S922_9BACT|nr:ribonuclease III [Silvibacterium dinghuense]
MEHRLGHCFERSGLLARALTHRSLAYEQNLAHAVAPAGKVAASQPEPVHDPSSDNEQLEFLGDAVLGFLAAEELCQRYPGLDEGQLTRLRAELVSRRHLGEVAIGLKLGDSMLLGKGEERSGGRKKHALLANCMEAVIAALYLDAGLEFTRQFVIREVIAPSVEELRGRLLGGGSIGDHKSALQERVQAQKLGQPEYQVRAESGPDHRKKFLVEVSIAGEQGRPLARGSGNTKKKAEQEAARRALLRLEREAQGLAGDDPELDGDEEPEALLERQR